MRKSIWKNLVCATGVLALAIALPPTTSAAPVSDVKGCDQFLVPKKKDINGKLVGQEVCRMTEIEFEYQGKKYKRLDVGVTGTLEGYALKDDKARYSNYFNVYPEFVYQQGGEEDKPVFHGIGRYSMEQGSSMTVIYPVDKAEWNGKLFVNAHGAGRSFARGNAKFWYEELTESDPIAGISKYEKLMIDKGYIMAKTRRSTLMQGGDLNVTLDDGAVLKNRNVTEQPPLIMQFAKLAANLAQPSLGALPKKTYWYGHSGGARPGRMVSYKAGINVDDDGTPIIDGVIVDDAGSGLWLPVAMKDGKDVVFTTDEDKKRMVPTIEIGHLLYVNETPDDPPAFRGSNNFLHNKRQNAKMLRDKGMWNKFRYYEIDGISHGGGENLVDGKRGDVTIIDMSRLMDGFIDHLDAWVEKGVAPPPTRSDWRELGDVDKDNIVENPAIDMPEVGCGLGVYHIFPVSSGASGQGTTGFAGFTGTGLEPVDGRGEFRDDPDIVNVAQGFVDMNGNGYRDYVETVTEAWQRTGMLKPNETFNRERFLQCVEKVITKLEVDKFFTKKTIDFYKQQARTMPLPAK